MLLTDEIYCGDCLDLMKEIPDKSIDMVLCDPPYGTIDCKWDTVIPLETMWKEYKRITKPVSAIVLFSSEPFTSELIHSNIKNFRYDLIWNKRHGRNPYQSRIKPLKSHETICVFSFGKIRYNPQYDYGKPYATKVTPIGQSEVFDRRSRRMTFHTHTNANTFLRYPKSVLTFNPQNTPRLHPTQKPIALCDYLIQTYTNPGDTVLDNCIGSGTTAVAAKFIGRHFIGIEKEQKYVDIAKQRIRECL